MRFLKEISFPGTLEEVWEMLLDADFRAEVAETSGASSYDVSVEETDEGWLAVIDSVSPTDGLPDAATRVLGTAMEIRQEELWTSASAATLDARMPGRPGHINGTISLRQDGDRVVQVVDAEVRVRIPLFGGAVEKVIGRGLGRVLRIQESVGADWLTR
jgi:hypothetical protein